MLTINQSIQNFLKKHHKQRIPAAISGLLSLVVAFSVCGSLIMAAISMTKSEEQAVSELNLAEDHIALMGAGISTAFQEPPENATNFESVITKDEKFLFSTSVTVFGEPNFCRTRLYEPSVCLRQ